MKVKTIIAIDPGANGGISLYAKGKTSTIKMPSKLSDLNDYIKHITSTYTDILCFVEKVSGYRSDNDIPGKWYGIEKMLQKYNQMLACLEMNNITVIDVYPISWQSLFNLRVKGESDKDRKNRYKRFASSHYPGIRVTLWNSDALCILHFARYKIKNEMLWIQERLPEIKNELF